MRRDAVDRYQHDPTFHALVDTLYAAIASSPDLTPSDIREAALMAATKWESINLKTMRIIPETWERKE